LGTTAAKQSASVGSLAELEKLNIQKQWQTTLKMMYIADVNLIQPCLIPVLKQTLGCFYTDS